LFVHRSLKQCIEKDREAKRVATKARIDLADRTSAVKARLPDRYYVEMELERLRQAARYHPNVTKRTVAIGVVGALVPGLNLAWALIYLFGPALERAKTWLDEPVVK